MDYTKAVLLRKSRRSYLKQPIPNEKVEALKEKIRAINTETGLHFQLVQDEEAFAKIRKNYGFFKNVPAYFALVGNGDDPLLYEKAGYYGELLVLEATMLGLGTCWVVSTYDKDKVKADIRTGEKLVCVVSVGVPDEKIALREKTIHSVTHMKRKPIEEMYECDEDPPPDWFLSGMAGVVNAPSAQNKQPVKIICKNGIISTETGKSEVNKIDLGIAKYHFDLCSKNICSKNSHCFKDDYKK